jgi:hypothetical protein
MIGIKIDHSRPEGANRSQLPREAPRPRLEIAVIEIEKKLCVGGV